MVASEQLVLWNQRWREGRDSYRPSGETIRAADYEVHRFPSVAPGADDAARDFVEGHHYSRSFPAARERFGLYKARAPWASRGATVLGQQDRDDAHDR